MFFFFVFILRYRNRRRITRHKYRKAKLNWPVISYFLGKGIAGGPDKRTML